MMRMLGLFSAMTVLMQGQTVPTNPAAAQPFGCLQTVGLFPGLYGAGNTGVGVGGFLNPAIGADLGDLLNPGINPGNTNPFDQGDTGLPGPDGTTFFSEPTTLVIENQGLVDILVDFRIDGFDERFGCAAEETCIFDLEECAERIDLRKMILMITGFGTTDPGSIDVIGFPEVRFDADTALDWPGPAGMLDCGDIILYSFDLLDDPTTRKISDSELLAIEQQVGGGNLGGLGELGGL